MYRQKAIFALMEFVDSRILPHIIPMGILLGYAIMGFRMNIHVFFFLLFS